MNAKITFFLNNIISQQLGSATNYPGFDMLCHICKEK